MTLGQEASGWRAQIEHAIERLRASEPRLLALAQGGTAIGTGINAHEKFAATFHRRTARADRRAVHAGRRTSSPRKATQDAAVEFSGQLRTLAVALMKIANDLRWMGSGPLAGLAELKLPALQPGSSIMPGKVNPVIPEAVAMIAAQVMGLDAAIAIAGQSGNFQLNVMLPLIANNLLTAIHLLAQRCARARAINASRAPSPTSARLDDALARNPILATALNPVIGYEKRGRDRQACLCRRAAGVRRGAGDVGPRRRGVAPPARSGGAHARRPARRRRPGLSEAGLSDSRIETELRSRILRRFRRFATAT